MASSHELLEVNLEQLKSISDEAIRKAYEKKLTELNEENDAKLIEQKKALLSKAYADLSDGEKRKRYIEKQQVAQPPLIVTNVDDVHVITTDDKLTNAKQILEEYKKFVDQQYKDHSDKDKFKGEEHSFLNVDQFKNSDLFKKIPKEDSKNYTKDNFPKKAISLTFDNWKDAITFIQDMEKKKLMSPGTTTKLKEDLMKKGLVDEAGIDIPREPPRTAGPRR